MIASSKDLFELGSFWIRYSEFDFIEPESPSNIREVISKYKVDIRFAFEDQDDDGKLVALHAEIRVNPKKEFVEDSIDYEQQKGYSITIATTSFIRILAQSENKAAIAKATLDSTISMIRGYVYNSTSLMPFHPYSLPLIDVDSLVENLTFFKRKN